ncbi:protein of unknown function [Stenotrophomonas maltophilia]|nr:protein of unknown function [Stenotrophomonas maltophilia]
MLGSLQGGPNSRAVDPRHAWMPSAWINQEWAPLRCPGRVHPTWQRRPAAGTTGALRTR